MTEQKQQAVLPPQIPVDRFIRTAITAVQMNPDLFITQRRNEYATGTGLTNAWIRVDPPAS